MFLGFWDCIIIGIGAFHELIVDYRFGPSRVISDGVVKFISSDFDR